MFKKKPDDFPQTAEALTKAYAHLDTLVAGSEEYNLTLAEIQRLHELVANQRKPRVDPDNAVAVAGNLLGILAIVKFERLSILTSKAVQFVGKARR